MNKERIEIILDALNISDSYSFLKPHEETDLYLQKSYSVILGEQALKDSLEMTGDPKRHLSQWDSIFEGEIDKQALSNQDALEIISRIKNKYTKNWRLIFLIQRTSESGDIDFADNLIGQLDDGDGYTASQCNAHREILWNMLDDIEFEEFKRRLILCKPSNGPKNRVIEIKKSFIEKYSSKKGFRDTLKIAQDKIFGPLYFPNVLFPETANVPMNQMIELIDKTPELNSSDYLKARVLLKYAENNKNLSEEAFDLIFTEVEAIDKSYKENGNRLQDMLAFDLGCSTEILERIKRCKKLITSPIQKRELGYHEKNVNSS
jgi:hypothetical protein